jgi:hypothetical protein
MEFYVNQLFDKMIHDIEIIFEKNQETITKIEIVIPIIQSTINDLKNHFLSKEIISIQDEIDFFKNIKPKFNAYLIYYIDLFHFEIHKPVGIFQNQIEYLKQQAELIYKFQSENKDFFIYFKSKACYSDQVYFIRNNSDFRIKINHFCFESDPRFSTSHDYLQAKFIANEFLLEYYKKQIELLSNSNTKTVHHKETSLKWTSSKSNLIELIYAIQESGCFNHGEADIKLIASTFSSLFDISLGDIYRTYIDLRARNNPTKFLENLKNNLENRMLDDDY